MSALTGAGVGPAPFRHEALLYADDEDYLAGTVPFVEAGLEAGEPVLIAVPQERLELLRTALPISHPLLQLADMGAMGRNPARIIPAWADFALPLLDEGRTLRGIGEPIWAGRSDDELAECAWHESLINTAFSEAAGFSILCPYDTALLDTDVIEDARGTHPHVGPPEAIEVSPHYQVDHRPCPEAALSPVPDGVEWVAFDGDGHPELRRRVRGAAMAAGLSADTADDAVLAVNEAVVNTVVHAGGSGRLRTWTDGGAFLCEVRDAGRIDDPLAGRRRPSVDQAGGRGLWLIQQLCDLVQVRRDGDEQAIRIRISPARPSIG